VTCLTAVRRDGDIEARKFSSEMVTLQQYRRYARPG
jgi:hypothetical protein